MRRSPRRSSHPVDPVGSPIRHHGRGDRQRRAEPFQVAHRHGRRHHDRALHRRGVTGQGAGDRGLAQLPGQCALDHRLGRRFVGPPRREPRGVGRDGGLARGVDPLVPVDVMELAHHSERVGPLPPRIDADDPPASRSHAGHVVAQGLREPRGAEQDHGVGSARLRAQDRIGGSDGPGQAAPRPGIGQDRPSKALPEDEEPAGVAGRIGSCDDQSPAFQGRLEYGGPRAGPDERRPRPGR